MLGHHIAVLALILGDPGPDGAAGVAGMDGAGPVSGWAAVAFLLTTVVGALIWVLKYLLQTTLPAEQKTFRDEMAAERRQHGEDLDKLLLRIDRVAEVIVKLTDNLAQSNVVMGQAARSVEDLYEDFWAYLLDPHSRPALEQRRKARAAQRQPPPGGGPGRTTT